MPVTKTARRALRGSARKKTINSLLVSRLEIATRKAKKSKSLKDVVAAITLADRSAKKKIIHTNKAARIKSSLSKLAAPKKESSVKKSKKIKA